MSAKFFTNKDKNTLLKKFEGIFKNNIDIQNFDALVGFLRASGYFTLRPFLDKVPKIRILVGINVDKIINKYYQQGLQFRQDDELTKDDFKNQLKEDIQNSYYSHEVEKGIIQFIEDIKNGKLELRAHPSKKIHAKIYIFRPKIFNEHRSGSVISGSSNLTDSGLGTNPGSNYEFNVELKDFLDVNFALNEFEELWKEGINILPEDIEQLKSETYLNEDISPHDLYYKLLIEYFGSSVQFDPSAVLDLPKKYKRLDYQIDAVNEGFSLLQKHSGFFLSDVVGTGKTLVATIIAKKLFSYNQNEYNHINNTLFVVPETVMASWKETVDELGLPSADFVANRSFHKIRNPKKYDLIIVDEAHKFKSNTASSYSELQRLCKTPTENILEDGSSLSKRVILISASPLNNEPQDIKNEILLFQDGKNSTLEIGNIDSFFNEKIKAYKKLKKITDKKILREGIRSIYSDIREKVISQLMVRRTRTDLIQNKQYKANLDEQGIIFPKVQKPNKIFYRLNGPLEKLYDDTFRMLSKLNFAIYEEIQSLNEEKRGKYIIPVTAYAALADIMKTLLVKRLDSSFASFKSTLEKFVNKTKSKIKQFENNKIYISGLKDIEIAEYILDDQEEELLQKFNDSENFLHIYKAEDFDKEFLKKLKIDLDLVEPIYNYWLKVNEDPKYDLFVEKLKKEFFDNKINLSGKIVVFSEVKITTKYLYEKLKKDGFDNVLEISSSNIEQYKNLLKQEFDANYEGEQTSNFNILLTTEVLTEGVNLHRSNIIINYDTPWNATKLIQRIGRVNRIGTKAEKIYVYNFFPTSNVEDDIKLEQKAFLKLQSFHEALGEDSQIYNDAEETQTFGLFDKDIEEERDEKLSLLMELRKFKDENEKHFRLLKKKSKRLRVGRKNKEFKNSTIAFIRNDKRNAFYYITDNNKIEEKTFVETAKIFKAKLDEKNINLHKNHHVQIQNALDKFNKEQQEELFSDKSVNTNITPQASSAISFLDACHRFDFLSILEKEQIQNAKEAVKLQKFSNLQREINRLKKSQKNIPTKPTQLIDIILKIISKYPLQSKISHRDNLSINPDQNINPEIIISESFI